MRSTYVAWGLVIAAVFGAIAIFVPEGIGSAIMLVSLTLILLPVLRKYSSDPDLITKIFFAGLALRFLFGLMVYANGWFSFFGGDAQTFDWRGALILDFWRGLVPSNSPELIRSMSTDGPGWGMNYLVAGIYAVFGRNFLAAQTFVVVFGAATAPLVHICTEKVFQNQRVARFAAIGVAIFPAFVIWSGQLLKDGLIIFLLVLAMTMVLKLQEKFSYGAVLLLIACMFGILSIRFYIFYMVAVAVAGSFVIGVSNTPASLMRRGIILVVMGVGLTYLGVIQTASTNFERYGDLNRLQVSRQDQAVSADSGYADDVDVSTTRGAITAIPIGFVYLIFAPFPWDVRTFRQAITLPEVFVWWAMIPMLVWGIWYTIRHRLRTAFPILLFSGMLTLAYSIFQSNVGTAYRQRTQIQVFFFMFIGVGWVLLKERRENKKLLLESKRRQIDHAVAGAQV
ncbi:MAG TPA: glycosyltransferase family 39 protein [Pyrinomonadaceae bacterium]|nr:glycosyltransferase family 39 protein [Pyrinomonadaceae bacterium]